MKKQLFTLLIASTVLLGANLHFSLHKKETKTGPTMLVIGGIHGDEPGGYYAPQVFLKKYTISSGNVWVIPNLNFDSIVANKRGVYGDMNRKFADISQSDKDFKIVSDIKKLILEPQVDIILNLHDGHGFYRQKHINGLLNPNAWGQACIIDQKTLQGVSKFGNLDEIAKRVSKNANVSLIEDVHEFNVKNTDTKEKDKEMQKSLTYFAIRNGKPAFAVETSKNISDTATKVLYQLKSLEEFMNVTNIKFRRDFELNISEINKILASNGTLFFENSNTILPLDNLKEKVTTFPVAKELVYTSDNPLIGIKTVPNIIGLYNGNKKIGFLQTSTMPIDSSLPQIDLIADGAQSKTKLAQVFNVKNSFKIMAPSGYRVNIIGFSQAGLSNENQIDIQKSKLDNNYAIDKASTMFRIEFYNGKSYCGNLIARFIK